MMIRLDRIPSRIRNWVHSRLLHFAEATCPYYRHVLTCGIENPGDKLMFERLAGPSGYSMKYDSDSVGRAEITYEYTRDIRWSAKRLGDALTMGGITIKSSLIRGVEFEDA